MNPRLTILFGTLISVPCEAAEPTAEQADFFETRIRPVLVEHCHRCHSEDAERLKAGLKLDSLAGLLRGGDLGPALDLDKPEASLLLEAIGWKTRDLQMPPKAPLPRGSGWILKTGSRWARLGRQPRASRRSGGRERVRFRRRPQTLGVSTGLSRMSQRRRKERDRLVCSEEIDESQALRFCEAPKHALIRRAYLTMIGLPPTPEESAEFVEGRVSWYEVVERLLASPHYGALWGRHWLDVARFADGYGGFLDGGKFDQAWRYRDWVMTALNEDMPYDRFLKLQLAGDLLEPEEHALATGFLALGPQYRGDGGTP